MMQTPHPDPAACGIFGHEMEAGRCACCGQPDPRQQPAEEAPAETYGTTPGQTWPPQASRYAPCSAGRRCGYYGACRCATLAP